MKIPSIHPSAPNAQFTSDVSNQIESLLFQTMLKSFESDRAAGSALGGIGESQISSLLHEEYARLLSERVDLRIAERNGQ